jgi:hypothetical protein
MVLEMTRGSWMSTMNLNKGIDSEALDSDTHTLAPKWNPAIEPGGLPDFSSCLGYCANMTGSEYARTNHSYMHPRRLYARNLSIDM